MTEAALTIVDMIESLKPLFWLYFELSWRTLLGAT